MSEKHQKIEKFSLTEYTKVQHQLHHQVLLDQHQQGKIILPPDKLLLNKCQSSSGDSSASSENGSEPASSDSEDDFNIDDYYFLQPVATKQRRMLLRQSGVKKIEPVEKDECKDIRSSREVCGCNCKVFCNPETCICSLAGIKCQVDRLSFPCGCSKDGCSNLYGRIEFNPIRVRTHFIHTLMRLELEKNSEWEEKAKSWKSKGNNVHKSVSIVSPSHVVDTESGSEGSRSPVSNQATSGEDVDIARHHVGSADKQAACNAQDSTSGQEGIIDQDEDLINYNSNERGSCRDCQSSEISDIIMRESQYSGPNQDLESCMQNSNHNFPMTEEAQMGLPTVTNPSESLPQVMLFSDDEEVYHAENTSTMFHFPKEESSYSESSDCSSEGSTSMEDQSAYQNYPNYNYDVDSDGNKICTKMNNQQSEPTQAKRNVTMNGTMGIPQPHPSTQCNYRATDSHGPTMAPPQQKYINLNNSPNGYKLEPISEILNPIRFSGYSGTDGNASGVSTWGPDYVYKNGDRVVHNAPEKPQCISDSMMKELNHQNTGSTEISQSGVEHQHFYDIIQVTCNGSEHMVSTRAYKFMCVF
jgi:cysteine/serine-rich nuclear protein